VDLTDYEKSGTWDVVDVPATFDTFFDKKVDVFGFVTIQQLVRVAR